MAGRMSEKVRERIQKANAQQIESAQWDLKGCIAALRGEGLPEVLSFPLARVCTIRGILHSPSLAEGEAQTLRGQQEHPEFTRALNARAIMSNRIPDMDPTERPEELPYCIWYPDVASEDTYRQLARKYPQVRYQVARACAVAGYTDLYLELEDVLPEVAVAEEALAAGSTAIYDHIMAQPVLHKVFDDYYRTMNIDSPPPALHLNGDTCVLSMIKSQKQTFQTPDEFEDDDDMFFLAINDGPGYKDLMYNITEDYSITRSFLDEHLMDLEDLWAEPVLSPADLMMDLLTSPLPTHLPAGNKDLLILTAAYHGDIDRYVRLRRPKELKHEIFCIIRGIYHNPFFALWWERQVNPPEGAPFRLPSFGGWRHIQKAITARHIMNNDISRALQHKDDQDYLPYMIWYPDQALSSTYRALAHNVPKMRESCARAAIYMGNVRLFDDVMAMPGVLPNQWLAAEAKKNENPHFLSALQSRAEGLGVSLREDSAAAWNDRWKDISVKDILAHDLGALWRSPTVSMVIGEYDEGMAVYDGARVSVRDLEMFLMVPDSWRPKEEQHVELDYKDWPPELVETSEPGDTNTES